MYRYLIVIASFCLLMVQCKNQEEASSTQVEIAEPVKEPAVPKPTAEPVVDKTVEEKPKPTTPKVTEVKKAEPVKVQPKPKPAPPKPAPIKNTAPKLPKPTTSQIAKIAFDKTVHEFGEIDEGDKVTHSFKFVNSGTAPLIIEDVSVSCGCTIPSYPIMPVEPGATANIGVVFNSKGKFGTQKPSITVKTNATTPVVKLYMSGSIKHVFEKPAPPSDSTKVEKEGNSLN